MKRVGVWRCEPSFSPHAARTPLSQGARSWLSGQVGWGPGAPAVGAPAQKRSSTTKELTTVLIWSFMRPHRRSLAPVSSV